MSEQITINVGGQIFLTNARNLSKASPFFRELIENHGVDQAAQSAIFVDRDPRLFSVILNFLRAGFVNCPNLQELGPSIVEANFYGIDSFIDFVRTICYRNLIIAWVAERR